MDLCPFSLSGSRVDDYGSSYAALAYHGRTAYSVTHTGIVHRIRLAGAILRACRSVDQSPVTLPGGPSARDLLMIIDYANDLTRLSRHSHTDIPTIHHVDVEDSSSAVYDMRSDNMPLGLLSKHAQPFSPVILQPPNPVTADLASPDRFSYPQISIPISLRRARLASTAQALPLPYFSNCFFELSSEAFRIAQVSSYVCVASW